ncbi:MAG: M55 family metallopeptidase [Gemmatimonadales bacterium]
MTRRALRLMAIGAVPAMLAAQQRQQAPSPPPEPLDTTPPEAVFGVTEFALARQKLEALMQPSGFTVYIVADMEGLAAAVRNPTEMRPGFRGGHDPTHEAFRSELAREVNAAIAGARAAGATQFVVNEGHGGTLFRNIHPEELDSQALLIRGYPKPIVMTTGLNPKVDAIFIIGAHANAGTSGVISHNFAFDSFTVNGLALNEAGIAAFIGGELGVPLVLATGDNVLTMETQAMLGAIETVTTKLAHSRSAAAVFAPAVVQRQIRAAAARAVRRTRTGELKPLRLEHPYQVSFCLRASYQPWVAEQAARLSGVQPKPGDASGRCFVYQSDAAEEVGNLLNKIEWIVLKP